MSDTGDPESVVKRGDEVTYEPVEAAEGLSKGVLIDESDGAPHFAMRRFELAPDAAVPATPTRSNTSSTSSPASTSSGSAMRNTPCRPATRS